jgi:hypothetical protein
MMAVNDNIEAKIFRLGRDDAVVRSGVAADRQFWRVFRPLTL